MPKRKPKDPKRSADMPHQWIERHLERLEAFVYYDAIELTTWHYRRARLVGAGEYEYLDADWGTIRVGEEWGGPDTTAFFRKTLKIPPTHAGPDTFLDIFMDGGETQLTIDGYPWQGLDWYRSLVPLGELAEAGREIELGMEAFIINYPYDARRHDERDLHRFARARLLRRDPELEAFLFDARFVLDAYLSYWQHDDNFEIEGFLLRHLEQACRAIGPRLNTREEARQAAARAREILRTHIFESDVYRHDGKINICAHSHLDIVYLWPLKETLRKNCRTTTNMLSLMREYPDYIYTQSQPYLYEKLQTLYPDVFEEVKQRIQEGRWEVIGAMYVEPDGNLLGPESFVRQVLFGKRFLREELGVDTEICWMPDLFGAMYTLPQILLKSGIKYFMTAKLNIWNDTNVFPHDVFRWRGPDGSDVITYFPPTHFAQDFDVTNLRRHWQDYREKHIVDENLFIYGLGDGGGGPTREMVEASLRAPSFPGHPSTQIGLTEAFFNRLDDKFDQLPVWDDELYLETHRGTYTTKGELKRKNRKGELLYRDVEILSAFAWLYGGPRVQEELNEGWKPLLLNQFHDTLPGSHVAVAVPDIRQDYKTSFEIAHTVRDKVLSFFVQQLEPEAAAANDLLLFNTLSWSRNSLVESRLRQDAQTVRLAGGEPLPVQHYANRTWFRPPALASLGWTVAKFEADLALTGMPARSTPQPPLPANNGWRIIGEGESSRIFSPLPLLGRPEASKAEGLGVRAVAHFADNVIETPLYRIEVDANGNLARIYDKANDHEVLSAPGNCFQVFEDDPGRHFGAWDIAYHFEEYQYPVEQTSSWQLVNNGPLFAVFRSAWQVLNSTIEQEMWLYADDPRIDFHTQVMWQDKLKLLKVAFPLMVRTRTATYDLPFGHIERSTHRNTGWQQAKFEVCGHKWADLSEGDYGVALLNDCKYGYDAKENVLRLSLVRSPVRPDTNSDIGEHQFTYSLLPHAGNWRQAQVDRRAYELNIPVLGIEIAGGEGHSYNEDNHPYPAIPATQRLLVADSHTLIVEALKQAEQGEELILRTFDSHGCHRNTPFSFALPLNHVEETNLLEENPQTVVLKDDSSFVARYTPYEIKTHRLGFGR